MKALLFVALLIGVAYGHSPVLLWPAEEFALPEGESVLDMMDIDNFQKLFDGKKIILFYKRSFNLEEVSYPKKPLSYLRTVDAIALQGVKSIHRFVGGLTSSDNLKFVRLADGDLDEQQDEIKNAMASNPGFAAILVGSGSHRSRRQAGEADGPKKGPACVSDDTSEPRCLAYIGAIDIYEKASEIPTEGKCTVACQGEGKMTVKINDAKGTTITVTSDKSSGGYSLELPKDSLLQFESDTTWAPEQFSYSCSELKLIPKKSADKNSPVIVLRRLQLYPRGNPDENEKGKFPESYDCATWFTSALWMGTVVALFYIFLLFGAVIYLLDVKTNDRFDDPKGKTITVNVAE